jgi:hypothetical protein
VRCARVGLYPFQTYTCLLRCKPDALRNGLGACMRFFRCRGWVWGEREESVNSHERHQDAICITQQVRIAPAEAAGVWCASPGRPVDQGNCSAAWTAVRPPFFTAALASAGVMPGGGGTWRKEEDGEESELFAKCAVHRHSSPSGLFRTGTTALAGTPGCCRCDGQAPGGGCACCA